MTFQRQKETAALLARLGIKVAVEEDIMKLIENAAGNLTKVSICGDVVKLRKDTIKVST